MVIVFVTSGELLGYWPECTTQVNVVDVWRDWSFAAVMVKVDSWASFETVPWLTVYSSTKSDTSDASTFFQVTPTAWEMPVIRQVNSWSEAVTTVSSSSVTAERNYIDHLHAYGFEGLGDRLQNEAEKCHLPKTLRRTDVLWSVTIHSSDVTTQLYWVSVLTPAMTVNVVVWEWVLSLNEPSLIT